MALETPSPAASTAATVSKQALAEEPRVFVAPQWQLVWWKFRKHKLAMISAIIIALVYLVAIFVEPIAPYLPDAFNPPRTYGPPQSLHFFHEGRFVGPYVFGLKQEIEQEALRRVFKIDPEKRIPMGFFVRGVPYKLWGVFEGDIHLFGPYDKEERVYLLGADRVGRDVLTRIIYGTRISMSIGLLGVFMSFILGLTLGGVSGYFGGQIDNLIQRLIEFVRSIPTIPLWMGLAAAIPVTWPSERIYFSITVILSFIGWTGLARVVRGRFLSLREEDFVLAARLDGVSEFRIIMRHMIPSFTSHIIASITLAIPGMILAETALSFLGLGLQPPVVSWGVLLQEAQNIRAVATAPWLLIPALAVIITVLALNFLGDGLRDAADPYGR
jgi:peptide/nickel transport system permease protein